MKNQIKKYRVEVAVGELLKSSCYWWTLTTPDTCDYSEISSRWRRVRHWLNERFTDFKYIQNFELHPDGHGWHIHFICNVFVDLRLPDIRFKFSRFGFGRLNCQKVYSDGLHEYLTKHALKAYRLLPDRPNKRLRLINLSRSLCCPLTRFQSVFGLSDRWRDHYPNAPFNLRRLYVPFDSFCDLL